LPSRRGSAPSPPSRPRSPKPSARDPQRARTLNTPLPETRTADSAPRSPVVILGAGLAGLSAAYHLGGEVEVFEKEAHYAGHSRTKAVDGFLFDEGAHVFFGKGECAERFVWQPLEGRFTHHRAEIFNHYEALRFGRYPVQVNAAALNPEQATRCVLGFVEAAHRPEPEVRTYEDWCRASFGDAFSEEFMLRYARKVWTVEPSELNTEWLGSKVGGRISRPSLEQVVRGAVDPDPQELNYLTEFAYPRGGFGQVAEPLRAGVRNLRLGCGLAELHGEERRIRLTDGSERPYSALISTIPLPELVAAATDAPAAVREAADRLLCTSIRCVNVGIAREDVGPGHWCYFYEEDIPFFRVSFPSKFAPGNAPAGAGSLSCEIAYSRRRPLDETGLEERVLAALRRTGLLREDDHILVRDQIDIPYAYVVFDFHRQAALDTIHAWMRSVDVHPCGRFGEWGYHWSFEAIESGHAVAQAIRHQTADHQPPPTSH
jgi:protoporphyrinogen oxidase